MSKFDKKYDAFQLFEQILEQEDTNSSTPPAGIIPSAHSEDLSGRITDPEDDIYYEIEYDSVSMPGVGRFVKKSQEIHTPVKDEVQEIFDRMRDISREYRVLRYGSSNFYDQRVQQENARIFYKQGIFMKDFADEYGSQVPFSSYFPYYQMMGYEQLRTYFTWRTQIRAGVVKEISLSYAFLYIYELLNNIGVENPQDGLDKLVFFWQEFREFDNSIERYVVKWLKDYHIYYELAQPFPEFIEQNCLMEFYPECSDPKDHFDQLCAVSKYDIRKSVFFTEDRAQLIKDCLSYTLDRVRQCFAENHLDFDDFLYQPAKNMVTWTPFQGALFYPWLTQRDRRVVFSEQEVYICSYNKWTCSKSLTNESGRKFLGYIFKQAETVLRQTVKYKYKLTASIHMLPSLTLARLLAAGIHLEEVITEAVTDFYRESTRTIVCVDAAALEKIRQEALITQEKLTVPEEEEGHGNTSDFNLPFPVLTEPGMAVSGSGEPENDPWSSLRNAFSETELAALSCLLRGGSNIKGFADEHGIMLEVLMDGINDKAMDLIGDSLVDEEYTIYEDYIEQVEGMVE